MGAEARVAGVPENKVAKMWRAAYSTGFWLFVLGNSACMFPVAVGIWALTFPFDKKKVVLHQFTCFWASVYTWINPLWPVTVRGLEHMQKDTAYVMVSNHLSTLDILVMYRIFRHFKWVSKLENFRVPFIGWNMSLNRYIPVRRGDKQSVAEMMKSCADALEEGSSVMIFPEGTRSKTGRLRQFKLGAFELAAATRRPILPIVIRGTAEALPADGFYISGNHIELEVLPPMLPEEFEGMEPCDVMDKTRKIFAEALDEDEDTPLINSPYVGR
mmetsp:Transcript_13978/g.35137  ORF Transcript_13978/g.35137 Transcript_13978/m.35137 type:complete len:272 (+) Transcript_13978:52-867(+)